MNYKEKTIEELEKIISALKVILEFSSPDSELYRMILNELRLAEEALKFAEQAREFNASIADLEMQDRGRGL